MNKTKFFTLLAALPLIFTSCMSSSDDDDNGNKEYAVIEAAIGFEDAALGSDGTLQGTSYVNTASGYVFDNSVESLGDSVVSYGYTVSNLCTTKMNAETSPYAAFTSMNTASGTKFAHYIPNPNNPQYIHRKDGALFKPYYMDIAISSKTIQAAINGYGEDSAFGESDSISVTVRGVDVLGTGSTNKMNFNIIYKNGLLQLDSYSGYYGFLKFGYLSSYTNLWIPIYLTDLGEVSRILIEMKSTKSHTPLGLAIDNFTTYTTKTPGSTTGSK